MSALLLEHYRVLLALHVISMIAWMAGMLYLPRLFVYHCDAPAGSPQSETFKIMERRLLRAIINPAMLATFLFGGLMLWANPVLLQEGWMHAKLGLVLLLAGLHGAFSKWRKDFAADRNARPARFYRVWNEIPAVLMVGIVFLVILKP